MRRWREEVGDIHGTQGAPGVGSKNDRGEPQADGGFVAVPVVISYSPQGHESPSLDKPGVAVRRELNLPPALCQQCNPVKEQQLCG